MKRTDSRPLRLALVISLFVWAVAAVMLLPVSRRTQAVGGTGRRQPSAGLPNYDIRQDKKAPEKLAAFRDSMNKSASAVADIRDGFAQAELRLRAKVRSLKVQYNPATRTPEVIAPDVQLGRELLSAPSSSARPDILKGFLKRNAELVAAANDAIDNLKVVSDYTNPNGNLSFVELRQEIGGIPVFQGSVKAGFTKNGEIVRVINNLAAGVDNSAVSADFGDPATAVNYARGYIEEEASSAGLVRNASASTDLKTVFGAEDSGITAEKMYFPTEPGVVVPAWRVLIWQPRNAYYVILDAQSGSLLWRKNITSDQTQPATYNVYINFNSMLGPAHSPFPAVPGLASPNGSQGDGINRTLLTFVGNEAPYSFNNLGWITDGNNTTDGNNVQAGLDRKNPNQGGPSDIDPDGMPIDNGRLFDFPVNPGIPTNPSLNGGDSPLPPGQAPNVCLAAGGAGPTDFQKAVVTQLFYITNRYHDETYRLGFTEQAGNFQQNNFGRGGLGNDRISAQAQDCLDVNNANFGTPADGARPAMQMYLWNRPTPFYDGSLDADVVVHELTHGLSNRLHGNASGLSADIGGAMGEGWSDFFAMAMLSQPTDPIDGIYAMSGYATYRLRTGTNAFNNYYYGIRRFPYAIMSATGGPSSRPHNPLTFSDIDSTQVNVNDGAFAPSSTGTPDQVHRAGEIWASALWEIRAKFIQRLGWEVGNRRVLQFVIDGMKLAPINPTFLTERDAMIAATIAGGTADDVRDVWAGFAIRGMGAGASIQNSGGTSTGGTGTTRVTQTFDLPNLVQSPTLTFSDAAGNNNGVAEPGERLTLTIPLANNTGTAATGVTLQVAGGGSVNYGTIAHLGAASSQISFTVPAGSACGDVITLTLNANSSLGPVSFTRTIPLGTPSTTYSENFDGVAAPGLPAGWTAASIQGGVNFVTTTTGPDSAPNAAFALDPTTVGGGTDLTSPSIPITAAAAIISFRNNYSTEAGWDGGVLEISIDGAPFQDIIAAGGSFIQNGYNDTLGNSTNNPLIGRAAWTGESNGYVTTIVRMPPSVRGKPVQLRWRFGADDNTAVLGWKIDNIQVAGSFTCSPVAGSRRARADFDGDGKTDLSVFRPAEGNWYVVRSTEGISVQGWGIATDQLAPADYDGDGKTDMAVFREANSSFYIINSNGFVFSQVSWGAPGDTVVTADYDGDGKEDPTVYRASNNTWYIRMSTGGIGTMPFGTTGDIPIIGDVNGDGRADFTIYRGGEWISALNGGGFTSANWGTATDKPVPADYDGDGKLDFAVYRPAEGTWYIRRSSDSLFHRISWGNATDIPVPGDYDGDGRDDPAVYRGGLWYLNQSSAGLSVFGWGVETDVPIPAKYIP